MPGGTERGGGVRGDHPARQVSTASPRIILAREVSRAEIGATKMPPRPLGGVPEPRGRGPATGVANGMDLACADRTEAGRGHQRMCRGVFPHRGRAQGSSRSRGRRGGRGGRQPLTRPKKALPPCRSGDPRPCINGYACPSEMPAPLGQFLKAVPGPCSFARPGAGGSPLSPITHRLALGTGPWGMRPGIGSPPSRVLLWGLSPGCAWLGPPDSGLKSKL